MEGKDRRRRRVLCFKYGGIGWGKLHELLMEELDEVLKMELQLKTDGKELGIEAK